MKALLFGASGNLGLAIAAELNQHGFDLTAVVRNHAKAKIVEPITKKVIIADVTKPSDLNNICDGFDVVISSLGKSISPNDKSKPTFYDIDYVANTSILNEAKKSNVRKFVYISAFHAEKHLHLAYFNTHHAFSELLMSSGINYSIIKPPALFCAYLDLIEMAKKGQLITIGPGNKKTNPIHEGDLAEITVAAINQSNCIIEAGGKKIYTRKELNEIIQSHADGSKKIRTIPISVFKLILPFIKLTSKNSFDKLAFFLEVMQHDTIAPLLGNSNFEDYIKQNTNS